MEKFPYVIISYDPTYDVDVLPDKFEDFVVAKFRDCYDARMFLKFAGKVCMKPYCTSEIYFRHSDNTYEKVSEYDEQVDFGRFVNW